MNLASLPYLQPHCPAVCSPKVLGRESPATLGFSSATCTAHRLEHVEPCGDCGRRQLVPCSGPCALSFLALWEAQWGKMLTIVDLSHLMHHGHLEDAAICTGERQEL